MVGHTDQAKGVAHGGVGRQVAEPGSGEGERLAHGAGDDEPLPAGQQGEGAGGAGGAGAAGATPEGAGAPPPSTGGDNATSACSPGQALCDGLCVDL